MSDHVPTRVVCYTLLKTHEWTRCAELRLNETGDVELEDLDSENGGGIVQEYFEDGIPDDHAPRVVRREDPQEFMRTAANLRGGTFYKWVDESRGSAGGR